MTRLVLATVAATLALAGPAAAQAVEPFPPSFQWGVATSGFQSEAGGRPVNADRRSDWWRWTHHPLIREEGRVTRDRVERGPGFWNVWRRDLDLARGLGSDVFRMGVEWSRIFPRSTAGARGLRGLDRLADQRALRHYRRVLRGIRARGMRPMVTLSHFTLPLWIHDPINAYDVLGSRQADDMYSRRWKRQRGWLAPATAREFGRYAEYLAWKLGDVVDLWTPINEPMVVAASGYVNVQGVLAGNFPPGGLSYDAAMDAVRNMIDGNARAYDAVKRRDPGARVGLVQNLIAFTPTDPGSAADVAATRHADQLFNRLFIDAAVRGIVDDDADGVVDPGERRPAAAGKADFIGVNYYFRGRVTALPQAATRYIPLLDFLYFAFYADGDPLLLDCPTVCTEFGTEVYPEGLRQVLELAGSYDLPVWITENGLADADDDMRAAYLTDHLRVLRQAMADGVADVRGYLHWSLVDNFEWAHGYAPRFGLYRYDPRTLRRTPRPSAALVRDVFTTGRVP